MHYWGDGWPYFADVEQAAYEIGEFCRRWGRIQVRQTKEKYGTARVYCSLSVWGFHSLSHPGYVYCQYPKWLWKIDCRIGTKLLRPFGLPLFYWQRFIYRLAYKRALKKYPHIRAEIFACADYRELLEGI